MGLCPSLITLTYRYKFFKSVTWKVHSYSMDLKRESQSVDTLVDRVA